MRRDTSQPRVRRSSRLSAGPLYLAVGLAVLYAVLVLIVPAMERVNDVRGRGTEGAAWQAALHRASEQVRAHTRGAVAIAGAAALAGLVLPLALRPARYLVWFVALAI